MPDDTRDQVATPARDDHEAYYERAAWPVGAPVQDPDDPARRGTLVRQCARLWVDRDRRPPLVRWHGTTNAVPIPWYELCRPSRPAPDRAPAPRRAGRLNGPMVERLRACAADTDPDWAGAITIYPPEARELVDLVDADADLLDLLAAIAAEIDRQDRFHPAGYPATRDGVFLGIKTAAHELDIEAIGAWRDDRCRCETPVCGHADWRRTRSELIQAAAVILRTVRSIDDHRATVRDAT